MNRTSHHDVAMYKGIKLFAGTGSPNLAQLVSDYINVPLSGREIIEFPNENLFVKLSSSVRGQDVYLIQTTTSPVHRNLMELLILIQTLKLDSAARITAIMPYLAYCRSDKKDQPRVPITARLVADMIGVAGADRYMILDPHAGQVQGFFSVPGDVLTGFHLISDHLQMLTPKMIDPVVVTVDLGFAKKGRNIAADLNAPIAFIEKRRSANDANAQALSIIGNVANRDVILVDDEIDTGGSIIQAVNLLKSNGALNVYMVCIHAVLSLNAAEKISKLPFTQFITTDTVPIPESKAKFLQDRLTILSVAPLIGEVILRAHEGRSVGEMFNE